MSERQTPHRDPVPQHNDPTGPEKRSPRPPMPADKPAPE
jgi:hypothetical protein